MDYVTQEIGGTDIPPHSLLPSNPASPFQQPELKELMLFTQVNAPGHRSGWAERTGLEEQRNTCRSGREASQAHTLCMAVCIFMFVSSPLCTGNSSETGTVVYRKVTHRSCVQISLQALVVYLKEELEQAHLSYWLGWNSGPSQQDSAAGKARHTFEPDPDSTRNRGS